MKSLRLFPRVSDYVFLIAGTVIAAAASTLFYTPAGITGGGVTGISTIIYRLTGIDQGAVMFCINIPLVLCGMKVFGWRYGLRTLIGAVFLSLWTSIIGNLTGYRGILDCSDPINVLLSAIFGGVLMGIGVGVTMKSGSNTGGTDIISQIIAHSRPFPVGTISLMINLAVVMIGGGVFGLQRMMFAIIAMYLSSQLTNYVIVGFGTNLAKAVYIISNESVAGISRRVISELGRGGTVFTGTGIYTANPHTMLNVIVPNHQLNHLVKIVHEEDPSAFLFVTEAYEVLGRGFVPLKKAAEHDK